jgi:hypothetical protein
LETTLLEDRIRKEIGLLPNLEIISCERIQSPKLTRTLADKEKSSREDCIGL